MTELTWHVWQAVVTKPDQCIQYAAPEDGPTRPDGSAWTDAYPSIQRGRQPVELEHVGTLSYPAMGPYGPSDAMAADLAALAPAGMPVSSSIAVVYADPEPQTIEEVSERPLEEVDANPDLG